MTQLDHIIDVQAGQFASALRHVPQTLDVFTTHFPLFPVLPGVLILDDLERVARLALDGGADGERPVARWRLTAASRVRFRRFVEPGDSMEVVVHVDHMSEGAAMCKGVVQVAGRPVTTVQEMVFERCEGGGVT